MRDGGRAYAGGAGAARLAAPDAGGLCGRGGNALLYAELQNTLQESRLVHADLTQVAESALQMRRDLVNIGGVPYKNHRVFRKAL